MSSTHDQPSVGQPATTAGGQPATTAAGQPTTPAADQGRTPGADQARIPAPRPTSEQAGRYETYEKGGIEGAASGYTALAGWLLILGGTWSFFAGLALVIRSSYFVSSSRAHYAYQWTLTGWGWANLIFGIVVVAIGVCVVLGFSWARWAGIAAAVIGGMGTFLFLPIYPFWSILVIALDVFIIWALVTGRRHQEI